MAGLTIRAARAALWCCLVVLTLGLGAGAVRLLPWWLAEDVPFEVSLPFGRALLAAALETSLLVGTPLGVALALALAVERGEIRALFTLGISPGRLARSCWPLALVGGLLAFLLDLTWDARGEQPGVVARQLVEEARISCLGVRSPEAISVPLVGVTWLCFPGTAPKVAAPLPGSGGRAWVVGRSLRPSDDLQHLALETFTIHAPGAKDRPALRLQADHGAVSGLPSWGRGARLPGLVRGLLALSCIAVTVFGTAWVVAGRGLSSPVLVMPLALLPSVAALAALARLDAQSAPNAAFVLVPLCAALTLAIGDRLISLLIARKRRMRDASAA